MKAALRRAQFRHVSVRLACVAFAVSSVLACGPTGSSNGSGGKSGTGGTNGTGGSSSGGNTGSGGSGSGGSASGGSGSGGSASGGSASGGSASGGSASGGSVSGGSASGGSASGGAATGGISATGGTSNTGGAGPATGGTTAGGSGGGSAGGRGGSPSAGGGGGSGPTGGTSGGGSTGNGQCPANATFCTGFEEAAIPSTLKLVDYNAVGLPSIDKTTHSGGSQSVQIPAKAGGGEMYLEAPASMSFWFRVYIRTDSGFTHNEHDSFMSLAYAGDDKGTEIVEENCMLTVNDHDKTWGSNGGMMQAGCHTDGVRLDANKWYCIEGFADGGKGDLQLFVDGMSAIQIAASSMLKHPYSSFRFGYREYNGVDRTTWYDDVAVAPQRISCLP